MGKVINGLTHRRGEARDAAEILALTRAAYTHWVNVLGREPLPMIADYDAALTKHRFDLLCSGGTLRALIETELRGETFWIENIAVDTALHGEGIGRSLLDLAKSIAIEQGCNHLRLCTNAKMARNIVIYKKYGFQIDREEVVSHGTVIYMSKPIG